MGVVMAKAAYSRSSYGGGVTVLTASDLLVVVCTFHMSFRQDLFRLLYGLMHLGQKFFLINME